MAKVLLVRHGETKLNSGERFWGRTDVDLSPLGVRQAELLRDRLAEEKLTAIYTSDLSRAIATGKIIAARHSVEPIICPELQETNFGQIEGLTYPEISRLYPELVRQWTNWDQELRFPGGESVPELNARVKSFLPRLEKHTEEETVLIAAHSAPVRLLICHLMGLELKHWRQLRINLASLSIVHTFPQGAILGLLNDTSHCPKES